ncbi:uncharacterized protein LOC129916020 [Episyrphus balteatus]|uniref:uncharacterized protein LOC129916020 n=1 Tax=Episyrphus balteatus TaxID=286459 RepID=UPI00248661A5|nr:uncharacterized protein LOC129916020 [Episyrphus balteatus]
MTISFDGFLDTKRLSFDSTVGSEFLPKPSPSSDGSYGVFSPPLTVDKEANSKAVDTKAGGIEDNCLPMSNLLPPPTTAQTSLIVNISGASSVVSSIQNSRIRETRRQSSVNAVSWNEPVSETCKGKDIDACETAIDYTNFQNAEDVPVTLRQKSLHRRHLSMGNANYSMEDNNNRHRYSNLSAPDEPLSQRPNSWGPVDFLYSESITIDISRATSHAECNLIFF